MDRGSGTVPSWVHHTDDTAGRSGACPPPKLVAPGLVAAPDLCRVIVSHLVDDFIQCTAQAAMSAAPNEKWVKVRHQRQPGADERVHGNEAVKEPSTPPGREEQLVGQQDGKLGQALADNLGKEGQVHRTRRRVR